MYLADTISRAFLNETNEQILPDIEFNSITYLSVRLACRYQGQIIKITYMYLYWPFRDEITCLDGLQFKGHKVSASL